MQFVRKKIFIKKRSRVIDNVYLKHFCDKMTENALVIQWAPLKGITVNVVIRLLLSDFQRPKDNAISSYDTENFIWLLLSFD